MGLYVENIGNTPSDKMHWLMNNAELFTSSSVGELQMRMDVTGAMPKMDEMLVCAVDNGAFVAVGVAFDLEERTKFNLKQDTRDKYWFLVKIDLLKEKCPLWDEYVRG
jgi:hypothetical protein